MEKKIFAEYRKPGMDKTGSGLALRLVTYLAISAFCLLFWIGVIEAWSWAAKMISPVGKTTVVGVICAAGLLSSSWAALYSLRTYRPAGIWLAGMAFFAVPTVLSFTVWGG